MTRVADAPCRPRLEGERTSSDVRSLSSLWLSTEHPLCEPFTLAATGRTLPRKKTRARRVVVLGPDDDATRRSLVAVTIWASYLHRLTPDSVDRRWARGT